MEIFVDADACPVKDEVIRVAERHGLTVHMVSNSGMRPSRNPAIRQVVVPEGPDAADDWIVENITADDVAITADILLASRCLDKKAAVIGPNGKPFSEENIGMAVAMRELKSQLRETGEISGHNAGFTAQDRSRFLQTLENTIQSARRMT